MHPKLTAILPAVGGLPVSSGRDSIRAVPLLALNDLALQEGVPRGVGLTRSEIAEISCQMITDAATDKLPCQTRFYRILEAMLILIIMGHLVAPISQRSGPSIHHSRIVGEV